MCAGGSQVCSGNIGAFTARPPTISAAATTCSVWVEPGAAGPAARAIGEHGEVGGAGAEGDEQQAQQHHRRAERGEEDEAVGGVPPGGLAGRRGCGHRHVPRVLPFVAPEGDDEPHRDQHDLERDEEEQQVAGGEHGQRAALDGQVAGRERPRPARHRPDAHEVPADEHAEQRRQQHERHGDAVQGEVCAHAERGDPGGVDLAGPAR